LLSEKGCDPGGADADLVVWDPEKIQDDHRGAQQSSIDYNVFEGKEVKGLPRFTLTRGQVAVYDGEIRTQEGHGKFVAREPNGTVNKALSTWKELTAPTPVERTGIPATGYDVLKRLVCQISTGRSSCGCSEVRGWHR
jgi:dihydropyrimidinase